MFLFCIICMFLYILGGDTAPNISVPCKVSRHNSELRNGPWGLSHAKKNSIYPIGIIRERCYNQHQTGGNLTPKTWGFWAWGAHYLGFATRHDAWEKRCQKKKIGPKRWWKVVIYHGTLPKTNIAIENPPFWWYLQGNMGIFMGYVSFREGSIK